MAKNVQIPLETFLGLVKYFCVGDPTLEEHNALKKALEGKLDALVRHETYSTYKTSDCPEEREKARQKYLDMAGIHEDWRW